MLTARQLAGATTAALAREIGVGEKFLGNFLKKADLEPRKDTAALLRAWRNRVAHGVAFAYKPIQPVTGAVREPGAAYEVHRPHEYPDRSWDLNYWLGRLEEAGSRLEDAASRHARIRAEMRSAIDAQAMQREGEKLSGPVSRAKLDATGRRQLAADEAAAAGVKAPRRRGTG